MAGVIVTGGAGFIGRHLCAALRAQDEEPIVAEPGFDWGSLAGLDVAAVFHLGAVTDTRVDWLPALRQNFEFSRWLLEWCQDRSAPLIYASSAAVYGASRSCREWSDEAPLSGYAWSKWLFDLLVRERLMLSSLSIAGLRFFNVYGRGEETKGDMASPVHRFAEQIRARGRCTVFADDDGPVRRDFVHVSDVVKVMLWAWHAGARGVFNVGTGTSFTFEDVAEAVIDRMGRGTVELGRFPEGFRFDGYQQFTLADLSALRAAGYSEVFLSLKEGIEETITRQAVAA